MITLPPPAEKLYVLTAAFAVDGMVPAVASAAAAVSAYAVSLFMFNTS